LLAAVAFMALLAGCGGAAKPSFQAASGWHLLSNHGELAAANVPFAAADRSAASPPSRTVATLPRDGVMIWAMFSRPGGKLPARSAPLPLRLTEAMPSNPFEGFRCAPAVPESRCYAASGSVRRLGARVGPYYLDLYVFFGTDHPAVDSVAAADAELARLRIPHARSAVSTAPVCPALSGKDAYRTTVSPSAGPPGSTVTVSGPLGVVDESGTYGGQTATHVDAYWNLDFARWWSALTGSPSRSVEGPPVRHLARQEVAKRCGYRLRLRIPLVAPGTYPIEVLYGDSKGRASLAPVEFRVTQG
jgi:hypothetical protein